MRLKLFNLAKSEIVNLIILVILLVNMISIFFIIPGFQQKFTNDLFAESDYPDIIASNLISNSLSFGQQNTNLSIDGNFDIFMEKLHQFSNTSKYVESSNYFIIFKVASNTFYKSADGEFSNFGYLNLVVTTNEFFDEIIKNNFEIDNTKKCIYLVDRNELAFPLVNNEITISNSNKNYIFNLNSSFTLYYSNFGTTDRYENEKYSH